MTMTPDVSASLLRLCEALTWRQVSRDRSQAEQRMRRQVVRLLRKQGRAIVAEALPLMRPHLIEAAIPPLVEQKIRDLLEHIAEEYRDAIIAILLATALRAYSSAVVDVGVGLSFDLPTLTLQRILGEQAGALIAGINETTREIVREMITQGVANSQSYSTIAKALRERFAEFAPLRPQRHIRDRATLIAVTEIGNAYTQGQLQQGRDMEALGMRMEKAWLTSRDDRVTDGCRENEGAGWIPLNDPFPSGHQGPLRFPGCRCALQMRRVQTP